MPKRKKPSKLKDDKAQEEEEQEVAQSSESSSDNDSESADIPASDSESSDDEDGQAFDVVDVDFEFFDPSEKDFHSLKALLQGYLDGEAFDVSSLADTVIQQATVGTVVKTGEDGDPIALISALSLERYKSVAAIQQIKAFLTKKCPKGNRAAKLEQMMASDSVALLLSERLLNSPPELSAPLMNGLFMEIEWAWEDEPTQELRESFKFSHFLVFTKLYKPKQAAAVAEAGTSQTKKKGKKSKGNQEGELPQTVFIKPEDEYLFKHCEWHFSYPQPAALEDEDEDLLPYRLVMCITFDKAQRARAALDAVFADKIPKGQNGEA